VRDPNGTITAFNPPGSATTFAFSVNDKGAITGFYETSVFGSEAFFGFVRDPDGKFTSFGDVRTQPTSVNYEGAITGYFAFRIPSLGFVRSPEGTITSVSPPFCPQLASRRNSV
jgi:hypothetical protein